MAERSSIFDMIGPVMIGPSSSHTAGVVRIGRVARRVLGEQARKAEISFYNSFARTYEGHGSDRAVLAGLLDFETDDERIRTALDLAAENELAYEFKAVTNASALHPNAVRIKASNEKDSVELLGISRGGGLISIVELNGFGCNFTARRHTLIVTADDMKGSIAFLANILSNENCNIATMTVDRNAKNATAQLVIEMDSEIRQLTVDFMESQSWITKVIYLPEIHL